MPQNLGQKYIMFQRKIQLRVYFRKAGADLEDHSEGGRGLKRFTL